MKSPLTVVLFVTAALSGLALARPAQPQKASLESRVQALETQLAEQKAVNQTVASDLREVRELAEATVAYLDAQAKAAQDMQGTLDQSEELGFTYGINPRSREVLLAGWREVLATMQADLPKRSGAKANGRSRGRPQ